MSDRETLGFGKVRGFLWPIRRDELKKFIPMLMIFFLIAFNYNLLRASKDTMIVTAPSSGAEAIPFVKVWFMLPMAFVMTYLFTRLSNRHSREKVFYIMLSIFLAFFFVFTFILYPNREFLHPNQTADTLQAFLPAGLKGLVALFRNWIFTAFYVMSELWSAMILTVLFWGFANEVTGVKEAKRFYALFGMGANISGIFAGQAVMYLSSSIFRPIIPYGNSAWDQSVLFLNCTIMLSGLGIIILFRWLNKKSIIPDEASNKGTPKEKIKTSLRNNFKYLAKSKYLLCIAAIVMAYNLGINLVEVVWKNQVKALYPNPSDFNNYMGQIMTYMGYIATLTSFFITGAFIRRFSWATGALVPPAIMLITGALFFSVILFPSAAAPVGMLLGSTPLMLSVMFGTMQNCMSRAAKYTLFDATKEMSFIPLSNECKLRGKAAIDGVGSRLGKSGGSLIHQVLLIAFTTISASTPIIAGIFLLVIGVWAISVFALGKQFNTLTAQHETIDIPEEESAPTLQDEATSVQEEEEEVVAVQDEPVTVKS